MNTHGLLYCLSNLLLWLLDIGFESVGKCIGQILIKNDRFGAELYFYLFYDLKTCFRLNIKLMRTWRCEVFHKI